MGLRCSRYNQPKHHRTLTSSQAIVDRLRLLDGRTKLLSGLYMPIHTRLLRQQYEQYEAGSTENSI